MTAIKSLYSCAPMVIMAALALGWAGSAAGGEFPATGQTTCYDSEGDPTDCANFPGQDGNIQAGATLKYKDNGNGTITDQNTGLVWEKKSDDQPSPDDNDNTTFPHDQDNRYTWDDAFAVHVATLNNTCANDEMVACSVNADCEAAGVGGKCGFAGKRDWRLPNVKELQSIVNYEVFFPSVSAAFDTPSPCIGGETVLTGSCTAAFFYWSSTTSAQLSGFAWIVDFLGGVVGLTDKSVGLRVRAVRGGL